MAEAMIPYAGLIKHGECKGYKNTPEYNAWKQAKSRCNNPNDSRFAKYGGRGIRVSDDWKSYERFLSDMGRRPSNNHSLDRIDNDGDYCKENCRWATSHEQMTNRSVTRFVSVKGKDVPLATVAKQYGIPANVLRYRILQGWSFESAVGTAVRHKEPNGSGRLRDRK